MPPATHWREVADIPNLISNADLEIRPNQSDSGQPHRLDGQHVAIRWHKCQTLEWMAYRVVKIARVYGETMVLLEKPDESRAWSQARDIRLIRHNLLVAR